MKEIDRRQSGALQAGTPNPQGKGLVGFLLDWEYAKPRQVVAKPSGRILADYFTSLLVLSAAFKFKPAFGTDYYLYRDDCGWSLSLISPDEWGTSEKTEAFVGTCMLHGDSTWSIEPSDNLKNPGPIADAVGEFYAAFVDKLDCPQPLEEEFPFYAGNLPYYQRLFAAALSRSLRTSLIYGDQLQRESRRWLEQLPRDATRLLSSPNEHD